MRVEVEDSFQESFHFSPSTMNSGCQAGGRYLYPGFILRAHPKKQEKRKKKNQVDFGNQPQVLISAKQALSILNSLPNPVKVTSDLFTKWVEQWKDFPPSHYLHGSFVLFTND